MKMTNNITGVFGRKGCGKTTLVKYLVDKSAKPRIVIIDFVGEYLGKICVSVPAFMKAYSEERVISFRSVSLEEIEHLLSVLSLLHNLLVVCSEVDGYARPLYVPAGLASICRYGRHRRIDLLYDSRRPAEVPRLLTSQSDSIYAFSILEKRDRDYLEEHTGKDCSKLAELVPFQYFKLL